jgi:pimeloyl-ACP methyl ester carboxylesterase
LLGEVTRLDLEGIGDCAAPERTDLVLDPERPLVVLVHGSHSSADSFRALTQMFALHNQQTVCFRYPDRDSLTANAARLRRGITRLSQALRRPEIMVFGHSQGGLIARAALASRAVARDFGNDPNARPLPEGDYRLVTVSSPFGGIRAASNCGSIPYHIASLGVSLIVCRAISGAKWNEIHPRSRMVTKPRALDPMVREHLTIVTDERDTCRRYSLDGTRCLQDDYVFSLAEQRNRRLERDDRVVESSIAAGHIEVLGVRGEPQKLLRALQRHGLLRPKLPQDLAQPGTESLTAGRSW